MNMESEPERAEQTQENWKSVIRTWNIDDPCDRLS